MKGKLVFALILVLLVISMLMSSASAQQVSGKFTITSEVVCEINDSADLNDTSVGDDGCFFESFLNFFKRLFKRRF